MLKKKPAKAPYNKVQSAEKNSACLGLIWMNALVNERNNGKICEETVDIQQGCLSVETFSYTISPLRQRESQRVS
ncbi:hypothetical protein [Enterobacter sp. CC120223-11]|uniref:hypothetical protein n=1 Tax=Enterobacter sp. CC120223-11 TaxID=1378073 RepID=UPI0011443944|nr:hypothetical protein [Enterobacter sp. CC120223-11]